MTWTGMIAIAAVAATGLVSGVACGGSNPPIDVHYGTDVGAEYQGPDGRPGPAGDAADGDGDSGSDGPGDGGADAGGIDQAGDLGGDGRQSPSGAVCQRGDECVTGYCHDGICTARPDGTACLADDECASGSCHGICQPAPPDADGGADAP